MIHRSLLALACLLLPLSAAPTPLDKEISTQVAAARAILDTWHAQDPDAGKRKLHIVYWSPSDREPCAGYQPRLTRQMEHIRGFYAKEMERFGFGSSVFIIRGDGKELWKSRTIKAGTVREFDLDLTGVKSLELITEDAGDSNRGDWALWLNPTLSR